jgi:tRNA 2-thiouridine synthesizing protein A
MSQAPDTVELLDARGLACPEPVLRLRARLRAPDAPHRVRLLATDPLAPVDVAAWCARTGDALLDSGRAGDAFVFLVQRGG